MSGVDFGWLGYQRRRQERLRARHRDPGRRAVVAAEFRVKYERRWPATGAVLDRIKKLPTLRFVICDRESEFSLAFDSVFAAEGSGYR
jgi:hypothetical protein